MNIFVAGATGTLGRPAVRALVAKGHAVCGFTRFERGVALLESMGAAAVQGNALHAAALHAAVGAFRPDVVVHLLTALPAAGASSPEEIEPTNILRIQGTTNLLRAAIDAGARRLVAESFAAVVRDDPANRTVAALKSLEQQLETARQRGQIETVALRFGLLYGPGVPSRETATPGSVTGVTAFVHIDRAADAIVRAVEDPAPSSVLDVIDSPPA